MRVLSFVIDRQQISKNPNCDFSGLVAGTQKYLQAQQEMYNERYINTKREKMHHLM